MRIEGGDRAEATSKPEGGEAAGGEAAENGGFREVASSDSVAAGQYEAAGARPR